MSVGRNPRWVFPLHTHCQDLAGWVEQSGLPGADFLKLISAYQKSAT